jgi:hypothetical protein
MQIVNNKIFDSFNAANGAWRNINNFVALSVHVIGLTNGDSTVAIEVSNNPAVLTDDTIHGIVITDDLSSGAASYADDILVSYDNPLGPSTVVMVNPCCLAWNYIRVVKSGDGSAQTQAWLFGQIG